MRKVKINIELFIAILYTFRFVCKIVFDNDGNYDLMFVLGGIIFIGYTLRSRRALLKNIEVLFLFVLIVISTSFAPLQIDYKKSAIYIFKILLCVSAFLWTRNNVELFSFQKFLNYSVIIFAVQTCIALFYRTPILWRLFVPNRLELFYLEPSELGVFVGLLIVLQTYLLYSNACRYQTRRQIVNLMILGGILLLSRSASGIIYTIVCIAILLNYNMIFLHKDRKSRVIILFDIILVGCAIYILNGDGVFANRIQSIISGNDSSATTRTRTVEVVEFYSNYGLMGCGLGNQRSVYGMKFFNYKAINYSVTSAIYSFALEAGVIGIIAESLFALWLIIKTLSFKERGALNMALLLFMLLYMYYGGYFTNIPCWIVFAIISLPSDMINGNTNCLEES